MTLCDMDRHNDSDVGNVKHRLVTDLVELGRLIIRFLISSINLTFVPLLPLIAIKVDHNNRPTIEPFESLIRKVQTYLQTLNTDNTSPNASLNPFTEEPELPAENASKEEEVVTGDAHPDALEDDQPSARSARSGSGSSSKSQNEMIEVRF